MQSVIITGTNGKTTTTRALATILRTAGYRIITNTTGSNLERGLVASMIEHTNLVGETDVDYGIWEVDEAAFIHITPLAEPEYVVITNLFRDQLDRYGEIDTVLNKWRNTVNELAGRSCLVLNGDDPNVSSLALEQDRQIIRYGFKTDQTRDHLPHAAESHQCPVCNDRLEILTLYFSHYGIYHCPSCGYKSEELNNYFSDVKSKKQLDYPYNNITQARFHSTNKSFTLTTTLPGKYNLYNLAAATSVALETGVHPRLITSAIARLKPPFGRGESFRIHNQTITIMLAKNPAGLNEVISVLTKYNELEVLMVLNDKIADGRDVSWIWDADLEDLTETIKRAVVSGTRAHDYALRLDYAGLSADRYEIVPNSEEALARFIQSESHSGPKFIVPTYTAMLEIREVLAKQGIIHSSWDDN